MKEDSVPAIIQARFGSTRLRGKALRKLGSKVALERVITAARRWTSRVIVATSTEAEDDPLVALARECGALCVRGPLDDVHGRYRAALAHPECEGARWFFRVTGDCPLLSETLARRLLEARSDRHDYLYFADDELPRGLAPELVRVHAFLEHGELSPAEREHVTLALYGRGDGARAHKLEVPPVFRHPALRLTLDYPEDAQLFERLFALDDDMSSEAAIATLLARPDLAQINSHAKTTVPVVGGTLP